MTAAKQTTAESFNENFAILEKHARALSSATELDIDGLLPAVQESSAAAAVCEARIKAVEAALEKMFANRADAS